MRKILVFAAILASLAHAGVSAQGRGRATATLAVMVTDAGGAPVGNVLVTAEGPKPVSARTEGGRLVFEGLPAGAYRLRFERDGYITLEREVTAKRGAPIDVKVTLKPMPAPPSPPEPPPAPPSDARPVVLDLPAFTEKNYIGRAAARHVPLACGSSGTATLIQINEPLAAHHHADADEFFYVIAGQGTIRMAGKEDRLTAGVFVFVPRGVPHTLTAAGRSPLVALSTRGGEGCGK